MTALARRLPRSVVRTLPRPVLDGLVEAVAWRRRRRRRTQLPGAEARFVEAYESYWASGEVPADAEQLLLLAAWSSGGVLPRQQAERLGRRFDPSAFGELPDDLLAALDVDAAIADLRRDGLHVAPLPVPGDVVAEMREVALAGPATPRGDGLGELPAGRPGPEAPTWWLDPAVALRSAGVRRLLQERKLALLAGGYLGLDPMIMSLVMWRSFAARRSDSRSAQRFHYDNDRCSFVKAFVYLDDVTDDTGPHVFVPGSQGAKPSRLLHGDRLSDRQVDEVYPRSGWRTVTGPAGTLFFADTQAFHKGAVVRAGSRSVVQINLACDRFGIFEPPVAAAPAGVPADLADSVASAPRYFSQLFTPAGAPMP